MAKRVGRHCYTDSRAAHPSSHSERTWVQVFPDSRPVCCCSRVLRWLVGSFVPDLLAQNLRPHLRPLSSVLRRGQTTRASHARLYPLAETRGQRTLASRHKRLSGPPTQAFLPRTACP